MNCVIHQRKLKKTSSMASFTLFFLSVLFTFSTTISALNTAIKTTQESPQQLQFNTIIDSIVGAGDFSNWANLLSQADPSFFPLAATFFIPDDRAFLNGNHSSPSSSSVNFIDPLLFPYHIVPRRFSFTDLRQFPVGARLPTALPGNTLLITNNSAENFTIDGAKITHTDLFQNAVVSVQGVGDVLDYTLFGKDDNDNTGNNNNEKASVSSPEMSAEQDLNVGPTLPMPSVGFRQEERGPVVEIPKSATLSLVDELSLFVTFLCFCLLMLLCSLVLIRTLAQAIEKLVIAIIDMFFVFL